MGNRIGKLMLAVEFPLRMIFVSTNNSSGSGLHTDRVGNVCTCGNSHRREGVIIPMTIPFFLNISGISLPCQSGAGAGDSDGFMAEITNRPKETGSLFFLWISGSHLVPIIRKTTSV